MPYAAEISRSNPACFLFVIDQSGSMEEPFGSAAGESSQKKATALADIVNRLLANIAIRCSKGEGVRDYFHLGVLGYGTQVGSAFGGALSGRDLVPISELANNPLRVEERIKKEDDGAGGLLERKVKFPVWFEPVANGGTPMVQALGHARTIVQSWLASHASGFPPIVFNITDGESTDGEPSAAADQLKSLGNADGSVLVFNIHLSSAHGQPIVFPASETQLPNDYARLLFRMSSELPPQMRATATQEGLGNSESSRGMAFNSDLVCLVRLLEIGTRPSNLR